MVIRQISQNSTEIAGGVAGMGGTVALREFADVRNGAQQPLLGTAGTTLGKLTLPSVAWGLGTGTLAGLGWLLMRSPRGSPLTDFMLAHAITGVPSGAVSAAMPKQPTTTTAGAGARRSRSQARTARTARSRSDGGQARNRTRRSGGNEFAETGEFSEAN